MPYHEPVSPDRAQWRHEYLRHPEGIVAARFAPMHGTHPAAHRMLHHSQLAWARLGLHLTSARIRLADRDEPIEQPTPDPNIEPPRRRWLGLRPAPYLVETDR